MTGSFMTSPGPRASPQNPHKSAFAAAIPTKNPRAKRHYRHKTARLTVITGGPSAGSEIKTA